MQIGAMYQENKECPEEARCSGQTVRAQTGRCQDVMRPDAPPVERKPKFRPDWNGCVRRSRIERLCCSQSCLSLRRHYPDQL